MTTALIILLAFIAVGALMAAFVRNDGYGARASTGTPPRSHPADVFESHSFV
jgi:hypothetical protein